VANLQEHCDLQVVAAICDGAGCNRLFQKMCVIGEGARGIPNAFTPNRSAWCWNPWALDPQAKIFFISDPSHFIKKVVNHWEKSASSGTRRHLRVPEFIMQAILKHFPPPGMAASPDLNWNHTPWHSAGEEFYIRLFRRVYDLLASRRQTLYDSVTDSRIGELKTALQLVRAWYECNEHIGEVLEMSATDCHSHFLSHQLYWDIQCMIEGFIGLIQYRETRWGKAAVRARNCSQDSLESLFGRIRMACGSGQSVSMIKAVQALPREDARTQVRWAAKCRNNTNSGRSGSNVPVGNSGRSGLPDSEQIRPVPSDFDAQKARVLACTKDSLPTLWPIYWATLRAVQEADETAFKERYRSRRLYWLSTATHLNKTGFSRMRVGLALDVMQYAVAAVMLALRVGLMRP
jgi:hypothetical protein